MRNGTTPELDHLLGDQPWRTDSHGNTAHRDALRDAIVDEVIAAEDGALTMLIKQIQNDPRKSFSKTKLIEMIEEYL